MDTHTPCSPLFDPAPERAPGGDWRAPLWPRGVEAARFLLRLGDFHLPGRPTFHVPRHAWDEALERFDPLRLGPVEQAVAYQGGLMASFEDRSEILAWAQEGPERGTCLVLPVVLERGSRLAAGTTVARLLEERGFWHAFAAQARVAWTHRMDGVAAAWGPYGVPSDAATAFLAHLLEGAHAWVSTLCRSMPTPFDVSAYGRGVARDGTVGPMGFVWSHLQRGDEPSFHRTVRAAAITALRAATDRPDAPTFGRGGIWQDTGLDPHDCTGALFLRHATPAPSAHARLQRAVAFAAAHGLPMDADALPPFSMPATHA